MTTRGARPRPVFCRENGILSPARPAGPLRIILLGLAVSLAGTRIAWPDSGPPPPSGEVHLKTGLKVRYEGHFNRNALRDSRLAGSALIALTEAGHLLRFDLATMRLTDERIPDESVACLGEGESGSVLAGLETGRVCRVHPTTLALTEIARLTGKPRWISSTVGGQPEKSRLIVVLEKEIRKDGQWAGWTSIVHDLGTGKSHDLGRRATAFLLDTKRRLWLGADNGEWGGWCSRLELDTGKLVEIRGTHQDGQAGPGWSGIYGFTELTDGQVWAYGGTMHMGFNEAFIRRVDGPKVEDLYHHRHHVVEGKPDRTSPYLPVTHVLKNPENGLLLVFAFSDVYRTDAALKKWKLAYKLAIDHRPGRHDAIGAYPAVTAVHWMRDRNQRILCATLRNGYVEASEKDPRRFALGGQFGAARVTRIKNTATGTLFLEWDDEIAWRRRGGVWEEVKVAPDLRNALQDVEDVEVTEDGKTIRILDVLPWTGEQFLLATDQGLWLRTEAGGRIQPARLPAPPREVSKLCRDGLGRLWLGGEGLWMIDADGKTLHAFDEVPIIGRSEVSALAADPEHKDGILVALGSRGVVFLVAGQD